LNKKTYSNHGKKTRNGIEEWNRGMDLRNGMEWDGME